MDEFRWVYTLGFIGIKFWTLQSFDKQSLNMILSSKYLMSKLIILLDQMMLLDDIMERFGDDRSI